MGNMRFKEGDRVRIKSLDWYNENKDKDGTVHLILLSNSRYNLIESMTTLCGKVVTIEYVDKYRNCYDILEDVDKYHWTDDMIEGLAEEKSITTNKPQFKQSNTSLEKEMEWNLPQGYQFKDENGNVINATKIVLEKIKKEYPKTYKECRKIINYHLTGPTIIGYEKPLLEDFQQLLICRDAYWKIAGEELGLGKSWKPDCNGGYFIPAIIYKGGFIQKVEVQYRNVILAFPTTEMRDAFYENFKDLIEQCKELL